MDIILQVLVLQLAPHDSQGFIFIYSRNPCVSQKSDYMPSALAIRQSNSNIRPSLTVIRLFIRAQCIIHNLLYTLRRVYAYFVNFVLLFSIRVRRIPLLRKYPISIWFLKNSQIKLGKFIVSVTYIR